MLNLILLGPPGAGKGTQAKKLFADFKIPQISTGDILREAARNGTEMGRQAKALMDQGKLVPDEVVIGIVKERLKQEDAKNGFILDGFPRTVAQAEALEKALASNGKKLDRVLAIDVAEEKVVERISGRRSCPKCGAVFHVVSLPAKREGFCDNDNTGLIQREDDREEKVIERMHQYRNNTAPLIAFYEKKGLLSTINGSGSSEGVYLDIKKALGKA